MLRSIPLLQSVKVASPCAASWDAMDAVDGDRVHFCKECSKNVYNLSAMTQAQAEGLLRKHEGRLCVRYYQRRDGTVLTQNCPVGAATIRGKLIQRSMAAAVLTLAIAAQAAMRRPTMMGRVDVQTIPADSMTQEHDVVGKLVAPQTVVGRLGAPVDTSDSSSNGKITMGQPAVVDRNPAPKRQDSRVIVGEVLPDQLTNRSSVSPESEIEPSTLIKETQK